MCKLIRINPDEKDHDYYVTFGEIYNLINESNKKSSSKSLTDVLSKRLLELELK